MIMPPFVQLELFNQGLKNVNVNFNIFPDQHNQPDLNIVESLWSVLETRVRNRFPPPASLKQLEDVLQVELCIIPLETVQNL
jgi:hypothetical protein